MFMAAQSEFLKKLLDEEGVTIMGGENGTGVTVDLTKVD